jgi:hypothetical protein
MLVSEYIEGLLKAKHPNARVFDAQPIINLNETENGPGLMTVVMEYTVKRVTSGRLDDYCVGSMVATSILLKQPGYYRITAVMLRGKETQGLMEVLATLFRVNA